MLNTFSKNDWTLKYQNVDLHQLLFPNSLLVKTREPNMAPLNCAVFISFSALTCWRPVQCLCNINHVDNDCLDSIPFAFHLEEHKYLHITS